MLIFFLVVLLLIPSTMVVLGLLWQKHPPKIINSVYGYKTTWSVKSKETWDFAHRYIGVIWLFTGILLGIMSVFLLQNYRNCKIDALGEIVIIITIVQLAGFLLLILPAELALRKRFNEKAK